MRRIGLLLCIIGLFSLSSWAESAELTTWQLLSDSYPEDMSWVGDGTLYVSLHNPKGIAQFAPSTGRLEVWEILKDPGQFVRTEERIFFAAPYDGQVAWFRSDVGFFRFFDMPAPGSWPVFVLDGRDDPNEIAVWYLDWNTGRVGLFAPIESGPADLRDVVPLAFDLPATATAVPSDEAVVSATTHPGPEPFTPSTISVAPYVSEPFHEWELVSPDDPVYGFTRTADGRIWISGEGGRGLLALNPATDTVTEYELPGDPFIAALASAADEGIAYAGSQREVWFLSRPNESEVEVGVLDVVDGGVTAWPVPASYGAASLRVLGEEIWFCDDELSLIYRFVPETSTFTWWWTGGDDAPRCLVPGAPGEMFVALERSGRIARLVLPDAGTP